MRARTQRGSKLTVLVAITGGSGSGKTTLARALCDALPPGRATLMSEDWYYRNIGAAPGFDPATYDFDHIDIRDHALMIEQLLALKTGRSVTAPEYDFVTHTRVPGGGVPVRPAAVLVIEGCHLLSVPPVAAHFDVKVYLDAPADVRFIRRLLRDQAERGRSAASVVAQYLATVRPAHERFTAPAMAVADVVVEDFSLTVERPRPAAIRRLVEPILRHPALAGVQG